MKRMSTVPWSAKSTSAEPIEASGSTSRGKYTFLTRFALSITERTALVVDVEYRFHARRPESRYTGKCGTGLLRTIVKTSENTPRKTSGLIIDHTAPNTDDVYLTFSSLRTMFSRTSRKRRRSRSLERQWSLGGSELRTVTLESAAATVRPRVTPDGAGSGWSLARRLPDPSLSDRPRERAERLDVGEAEALVHLLLRHAAVEEGSRPPREGLARGVLEKPKRLEDRTLVTAGGGLGSRELAHVLARAGAERLATALVRGELP